MGKSKSKSSASPQEPAYMAAFREGLSSFLTEKLGEGGQPYEGPLTAELQPMMQMLEGLFTNLISDPSQGPNYDFYNPDLNVQAGNFLDPITLDQGGIDQVYDAAMGTGQGLGDLVDPEIYAAIRDAAINGIPFSQVMSAEDMGRIESAFAPVADRANQRAIQKINESFGAQGARYSSAITGAGSAYLAEAGDNFNKSIMDVALSEAQSTRQGMIDTQGQVIGDAGAQRNAGVSSIANLITLLLGQGNLQAGQNQLGVDYELGKTQESTKRELGKGSQAIDQQRVNLDETNAAADFAKILQGLAETDVTRQIEMWQRSIDPAYQTPYLPYAVQFSGTQTPVGTNQSSQGQSPIWDAVIKPLLSGGYQRPGGN